MFQGKVVEEIKTHFMLYLFFRMSCRLWECGNLLHDGQAAGDSMAHPHCALDTYG